MKGGVAMLVDAFLRAARGELKPRGDLILAVLSDEENGGDFGARFLAEEHADLFEGVRHALGEFGGATRAPRRPQLLSDPGRGEADLLAARHACAGPAGTPRSACAAARWASSARILATARPARLPVHVTPAARAWIEAMADALPRPQSLVLRSLLDPRLAEIDAARPAAEQLRPLERALRNTVSATIVHGGEKINVIPAAVELELDGALAPRLRAGRPDPRAARARRPRAGARARAPRPGPADPTCRSSTRCRRSSASSTRTRCRCRCCRSASPTAASSRASASRRTASCRCSLPDGFEFVKLVHAADERVPADAVRFGAEAVGPRDRAVRRDEAARPRRDEVPRPRTSSTPRSRAAHEVTIFTRGQTNPDLFPEVGAPRRRPRRRPRRARRTRVGRRRRHERLRAARARQSRRAAARRGRPLRLRLEHLRLRRLRRAARRVVAACSSRPIPSRGRRGRATARSRRLRARRRRGLRRARRASCGPGCIVGPHDPTDRFTYWPRRLAEGGDVLAPGRSGAAGAVRRRARPRRVGSSQRRRSTVPAASSTRPGRRSRSRSASCSSARSPPSAPTLASCGRRAAAPRRGRRPVDGAAALASRRRVRRDARARTSRRALAAGLRFRPLEETALDTLAWSREAGEQRPTLTREKERELLAAR